MAQRAGFAPAMLGMAEIHLQSGQTSAARMVLKSVDQWTEDGPSLSRAAGLLLQLRCEEEAERAATRALAAKATNRATIHRIRGEREEFFVDSRRPWLILKNQPAVAMSLPWSGVALCFES